MTEPKSNHRPLTVAQPDTEQVRILEPLAKHACGLAQVACLQSWRATLFFGDLAQHLGLKLIVLQATSQLREQPTMRPSS